jgi:hypothetical protein
MTTAEILSRFSGVRPTASGYAARCPAHEDRTASLVISTGDDLRTLVHCHAGCSVPEILTKIGLEPKDLFVADSDGGHGMTTIATVFVAGRTVVKPPGTGRHWPLRPGDVKILVRRFSIHRVLHREHPDFDVEGAGRFTIDLRHGRFVIDLGIVGSVAELRSDPLAVVTEWRPHA